MGFFDSFLNNKSVDWPGSALETMEQLDVLLASSYKVPQLIFKHSTRCSISSFVLNEFKSKYSFSEQDFSAWYLDLLSYRAISNAIAQQLEVTHQSPQLLVIKNGKAVAHASHEQINSLLLIDYIS
jgi:bacillithiol system protein YtxJ